MKENKMQYKNVEITISESTKFFNKNPKTDSEFVVSRKNGMIFAASSVFGKTYAVHPEMALDLMKTLIDQNV